MRSASVHEVIEDCLQPHSARGDIRLLFCADTHLGFDEPVRPRIERRRRGSDFFANFQRVLDLATERRADLLIHGGDLFFRSRVPPCIVDRVYSMLVHFADRGIPILIVPGNHERSILPTSLFLSHPHIHVFRQPETKVFESAAGRIACSGFPCVRHEARDKFAALVEQTGWRRTPADLRFLCLHQTIEGAQVGPADFTFRRGEDVIRPLDLPAEFDAVLSGHIHRRQLLARRRPDGSSMAIVYPGSIERTSFAEKLEPKGCFFVTARDASAQSPGPAARRRLEVEFLALPARPMEDIFFGEAMDAHSVRPFLRETFARLPADAVVRLHVHENTPPGVRAMLTGRFLREVTPPTMNVQLAGGMFPRTGRDG